MIAQTMPHIPPSILDQLGHHGLTDNTIVILMSDNGHSGESFMRIHPEVLTRLRGMHERWWENVHPQLQFAVRISSCSFPWSDEKPVSPLPG